MALEGRFIEVGGGAVGFGGGHVGRQGFWSRLYVWWCRGICYVDLPGRQVHVVQVGQFGVSFGTKIHAGILLAGG